MGDWERIHRGNRYYWVKRDSRGRIIASRDTHPHPGGGGSQCFVVSVSSNNPFLVEYFRTWRDLVLEPRALGRLFIRVYWVLGPQFAKVIMRFPRARSAAGAFLHEYWKVMRSS